MEDWYKYNEKLREEQYEDWAQGLDSNEPFEDIYPELCAQCHFFNNEYCDKYPSMNQAWFGRKKKCKYFKRCK